LSAGSYALSGTAADKDPSAIASAFEGRSGWQTMISSAFDQNAVDAELDGLRAQIVDRDTSISGGTSQPSKAMLHKQQPA